MSDWDVGGVTLPGDLEWTDELAWAESREAQDLSLSGGVLIQKSKQAGGRPLTLDTDNSVYVTRQQVLDLQALRDNEAVDTFTVNHPDGRTFTCRFRYGDGLPVDAANTLFRSPPQPVDGFHDLTLRLMIV